MTQAASGLLVIDKPRGVTSYDCVHLVKRILRLTRVGHCGTLDPLAEGVLLVLYGQATRAQESFLGLEKQYWFRAQWGLLTTTGDREGEVRQRGAYSHVTEQAVREVLPRFTGAISQVPPRYAALKFKGRPYYEWARKGVEIPRPARPVQIKSLEWLGGEGAFWEGRVVCSRGTYIRSLVEDIAAACSTLATLDALIRERVGPYQRSDAIQWDTLRRSSLEDLLQRSHAPIHPHIRNV